MPDSEVLRAEPPKALAAVHATVYGVCPMLETATEKLEMVLVFNTRAEPHHPMRAAVTIRDAKALHKLLGEALMDIAENHPEEINDDR